MMAYLHILSGPSKGRSFRLREGVNYIGRAAGNEIRIEDKTLSRKHARIVLKGNRLFITDLKSQNKTFIESAYLDPGLEVELKAGSPIALGSTIVTLSLSETDDGKMAIFNETLRLSRADLEKASKLTKRRDETDDRAAELLKGTSGLLVSGISVHEALEKILRSLTEEMKRVDRAAILLTDPQTGEIQDTVLGSGVPKDQQTPPYSTRVVEQVIASKGPVMISDVETEEGDIVNTLKVLKVQCVLCSPMVFGSRLAGVIYLDSLRRPYGFRENDLLLLMELGQQIALAVEKARLGSNTSKVAESPVPDEE
jgi:pSer/pThr/pTyr-binding forkhead associated (FHA) protein